MSDRVKPCQGMHRPHVERVKPCQTVSRVWVPSMPAHEQTAILAESLVEIVALQFDSGLHLGW